MREHGRECARSTPRREAAFTLVELLVVMVIALVLAAVVMPQLGKTRQKTGAPQTNIAAGAIWRGIQAYRLENGGQLPPVATLTAQHTQSPPGKTFANPAGGPYIDSWPDDAKGGAMQVLAGGSATLPSTSVAPGSAQAGKVVYYAPAATPRLTGWLVAYSENGKIVYRRSIATSLVPTQEPRG